MRLRRYADVVIAILVLLGPFLLLDGLHAGLFEHVLEEGQADEDGDDLGYREGQPDVVQRAGQGEQICRGDEHQQLARRGDVEAVHAEAEGLAGGAGDYVHAREQEAVADYPQRGVADGEHVL